ncbi:MAG: pyridoxal-phosphate dependent enzyme [Alphaproteobacteria bacterium]|nr:pyridoxal-phosphate dependent enzyme [Alphaproteobacteria bacterium]
MDAGIASYIDPATNEAYPLDRPRWRSATGSPLMISALPGMSRAGIDRTERSLWRYRKALPGAIAAPISMGEGCTPLVRRPWRGGEALFKLEWFSPTGSFKDRGASVMMSMLREQGIRHVLEDSSGNGGAAIAAYAAAGGMKAKILTPASTQPAKTVQMRAYGAEVELVPGTRQDTADEAERQAGHIFYASHNWHPFFLQGTKTLAYELWEDLGFRAPDNVIAPTGAGSNVLGCDIGFDELVRCGEIARRPRLFAVQPANCAPIHAAFVSGGTLPVPVDVRPTIAEGTAIAKPIRLKPVLDAVRRSGGSTLAVTEEEIVASLLELAGTGLYAEPTSAAAAAAYTRLLAEGTIKHDETTVVVLTGSGLKATQLIGKILGG